MTYSRFLTAIFALVLAYSSPARAQLDWQWRFEPSNVSLLSLGYPPYVYATYENDSIDLQMTVMGQPVSELPSNGIFFVPELDATVVFTSLGTSALLLPGETVTLPIYTIVLTKPPVLQDSWQYTVSPLHWVSYGSDCTSGVSCSNLTSALPTTPLTLSVTAVPEPASLALFLLGLLCVSAVARGSRRT